MALVGILGTSGARSEGDPRSFTSVFVSSNQRHLPIMAMEITMLANANGSELIIVVG